MNKAIPLVCTLMAGTVAHAQIPNPGFETWISAGSYDEPEGYLTWNALTHPFGVLVCTQGMPGHTGASHIMLTTQNAGTIVPAVATTGDPVTGVDGFPCTVRPTQLLGWWQYQSGGGIDQAALFVSFTRWNNLTHQRDDIGAGYLFTVSDVIGWTPFTVPITYSSPDYPDTATIILTSSGSGIPAIGSTLRVDDLSFDISTGITATASGADASLVDGILRLYGAAGGHLSVRDALGRELHSATVSGDLFTLDLSDAPAGVLLVEWMDTMGEQRVFRGVR